MSWHGGEDVWASVEAARTAILERQQWKCAQCGDSLRERSMCAMEIYAEQRWAITCVSCASQLNRLRALAARWC